MPALPHTALVLLLHGACGAVGATAAERRATGNCLLQLQSRVKQSAGLEVGGMMNVKRAVFENRCSKPVYVYGTQDGVHSAVGIPPHATEEFNETRGFAPWREQRITVSFGLFFEGRLRPPSFDATVVELNADYRGFTVPKSHMNFISQVGFSDLNLEVALWKDRIHGTLAAEGGNPACFSRAKTAFRVAECSFPDNSGEVLQRSWGELCAPVCPSTGLASEKPCNTSCFVEPGRPVEYARYCSHQSLSYKWGRWRRSPATIGQHVRECAQQWSPTFECWDGQDGPEGFPICDGPDARELPDDLGVWQVIACPDSPSGACGPGEETPECRRDLEWAMEHGIHLSPDWYPGLTPGSSREEFQWAVHERLGTCPEPCAPNSNVAPPPKCGHLSAECIVEVLWAMHYGIYEHPEWYPGLKPTSSQDDFQRAISRSLGTRGSRSRNSTCPDPDGGTVERCPELSDACKRDLDWAMGEGIRSHPDWYPGLTVGSPRDEFQQVVHERGGTCPGPCGARAAHG